jgi:phospholipid/cholesterol/gamma-HCH transport system substrate-binding protein
MARRLTWSDVRGGLLACLAIVVVATAILKFSRVGALHGATFPLYAFAGDARGLLKGSEVWLNGQKIGKVTDIHFRSPQQADTLHRVSIEMEILSKYRDAMRHDAVAEVRPGGSFIGPVVVYLSPGTTRGGPMREGDTLRVGGQPDYEQATSQLSVAARELPAIMGNVNVLRAELTATRGTIGAMLNGPPGGASELQRVRVNAGRLGRRLSGGGTVGLFMDGGLTTRAQRVMGRVDSVRALLASNETSLGRFRRDSSLTSEVADIRNELTLVRALMASPEGTVGRAMRDSAMTNELAEAQRQMALLVADLKQHPFRYISF